MKRLQTNSGTRGNEVKGARAKCPKAILNKYSSGHFGHWREKNEATNSMNKWHEGRSPVKRVTLSI